MLIRSMILLAALFFAGCASNPMVVAPDQQLAVPSASEAQVIFMRSSYLGSAISASLYDVTDDDVKFIGIIDNGTKLAYTTPPGKRMFMVVSEAADYMEAELAPGKNYFSIVTPRMGAWKARFSLWPIKNNPDADYHTGMPEFVKWNNSTRLVMNGPKSQAWFDKNKAAVSAKHQKYSAAWANKTEEDLQRRTLVQEDGIQPD